MGSSGMSLQLCWCAAAAAAAAAAADMQSGVTPCQLSSLPGNKTLAFSLDSKDAARLVSHLCVEGVGGRGGWGVGCVCVCMGGGGDGGASPVSCGCDG